MNLTLPYAPSANRYWRNYRGVTVVSDEARDYKDIVRLIATRQGVEPVSGPVALTVTVYRPRKSGDLDNRLKVLLDALGGVAYHDDKQVRELHAYLCDDRTNPRVEVVVQEMTRTP
jgi:crossover junction endodeoxyribonuclease RusA